MLTPELTQAIRAHAVAEYPQECCGYIAGGQYVPMVNLSGRPETAFSMDLEGKSPDAIVHSHPDGLNCPSARDMAQQHAMRVPWVIVKVTAQGARRPVVLGGPKASLIGRQFIHGVHDCYSLIQDWYQEQGRRELTPEVPRDWNWWESGQSLYLDHYELAGWVKTDTPTTGAVGLIKTHGCKVANHAGVLVTGGKFLHHLPGRLSKKEEAFQWRQKIELWLHHPGFEYTAR